MGLVIGQSTQGLYSVYYNLYFYRAMLAQSAVMRLLSSVCLSVRPSVHNVQVPCSNRFEFFENNFTAE